MSPIEFLWYTILMLVLQQQQEPIMFKLLSCHTNPFIIVSILQNVSGQFFYLFMSCISIMCFKTNFPRSYSLLFTVVIVILVSLGIVRSASSILYGQHCNKR